MGNGRRLEPHRRLGEPWFKSGYFFDIIFDESTSSYQIIFPDQTKWVFNWPPENYNASDDRYERMLINKIVDRNGNSLTFSYEDTPDTSFGDPPYKIRGTRLKQVTDTLGRPINFTYHSDGRFAAISDFAGRVVKYDYYPETNRYAGCLKSVNNPAVTGTPNGNDFPQGKTTQYEYGEQGKLKRIIDPKGQVVIENHYSKTNDSLAPDYGAVTRQVWGGDVIDLRYYKVTPDGANNGAVVKTIINDRNGNVREYFHDAGNRCVLKREYTGRADPRQPTTETENRPINKLRPDDPDYFETRYFYNRDSKLVRIQHPNGNLTDYIYEGDQNPSTSPRFRGTLRTVRHSPGSHSPAGDQPQIEQHFEYATDFAGCCGFNFVTRYTDGRGNARVNEYDAFGNMTNRVHAISNITERFEYNSRGQMTKHVHPDNGSGRRRLDVYNYYESGPMRGYLHEKIVDAGGFNLTTRYEYDLVGNLTKMIDGRGHDTLYAVNQLNQLTRRTSPEVLDDSGVRYVTEYFYDANNNLVRVEQQNRRELLLDGGAPFLSMASPPFTYPAADGGVIASNPTWTTRYDHGVLNELIRRHKEVESGRFIVTEYGYDGNRNHARIRFGEATAGHQPDNVVQLTYDERNLLFRESRGAGGTNQASTQFDYDRNGNLALVREGIEADAHLTQYAYDGYNRMVSMLDAMGNVTTKNFDGNGNQLRTAIFGELVDGPGSTDNVRLSETFFDYDAKNRLTNENVAFFNATNQAPILDGWATTRVLYTDDSHVFAVINDNNHGRTNRYDSASRLVQTIDAKGNTVSHEYDGNSNPFRMTEVDKSDLGTPDEVFVTTTGYDSLNRAINTTDNVGNLNRVAFDSRNNRTLSVDANTNVVRYLVDGLSRLTDTIREMTQSGVGASPVIDTVITRQVWDDTSRLGAQIDDNTNATTYVFDGLNRQFATIFADGTGQTNILAVHGTSVLFADGNGNLVTNRYDDLDRLVRRDIRVGPGVSDDTTWEEYRYDGVSRLAYAADNDSIVARAYNSLGHVLVETQSGVPVGSYADAIGSTTKLVYPSGRVVTNAYDELERLSTVSDSAGPIATYDYVGPDRVAQRDYGNGTRTSYSYSGVLGTPRPTSDLGVKQIARVTHTHLGEGSILHDQHYTWDAMGNKTSRAEPNSKTNSFHYDSAYRLRLSTTAAVPGMAQNVEYSLDGVGNRLRVEGGADPGLYAMSSETPEPADRQLNQYTTTPYDNRTYDRNGNLVSHGQVANSSTLQFDYRNRLVGFTNGAVGAYYSYDALARRIRRAVSGNPGAEIRYLYRGDTVCEELGTNDSSNASFTYGVYVDEALKVSREGNNFFFHADDLHSTSLLTDALGERVEAYEYSDFGVTAIRDNNGTALSNSRVGNVRQFQGRERDSETGFYFFRSRYYSPHTGRFLSRDSGGIWWDNLNRGNGYAFVGNNPWRFIDPYGRQTDVVYGLTPEEVRQNEMPFQAGGRAFVRAHGGAVVQPGPEEARMSGGPVVTREAVRGPYGEMQMYVQNGAGTVNARKIVEDLARLPMFADAEAIEMRVCFSGSGYCPPAQQVANASGKRTYGVDGPYEPGGKTGYVDACDWFGIGCSSVKPFDPQPVPCIPFGPADNYFEQQGWK